MRAKKSLGQHFLTSHAIVFDIVRAADLSSEDTVLEIGPGKGILTEMLLQKTKKVIAVEKDERLVVMLKKKFESEIRADKLQLVRADILTLDIKKLRLKNNQYNIVANIPYYITGTFLKKMLSSAIQPSRMTLLVQKEVAERIACLRRGHSRQAKDKKESMLSLSVKAYGAPHYIKKVPARYFKPKPKIDSAILVIENISKDFFKSIPEGVFFILVRAGFAHKRKLLRKNIEHLFEIDIVEASFKKCSILPKARAEDVGLAQWKCLGAFLKKG